MDMQRKIDCSHLLFWSWCWCYILLDHTTVNVNGASITHQFDRKTVILPQNKTDTDNPISLTTAAPNKLTLFIAVPIAAGIFIVVLLFFWKILLEKPVDDPDSTDNYERLDDSCEEECVAQIQPSTRTSRIPVTAGTFHPTIETAATIENASIT